MTRGRKKVPKEVHLQRGSYKASRHSGPSPTKGDPMVMPEGMSPNCQRLWKGFIKHLNNVGLNYSTDQAALQMLVIAFDQYQVATNMILVDGPVRVRMSKHGEEMSSHPAVLIQEKAFKQVLQLLREFGLTPVARTNPNLLTDPQEIPDILKMLSPTRN